MKYKIILYLAKKGESIHHIAIMVDNLDAALDYLKSKNIKLINEKPQKGAGDLKIAFIHPHSTPGILLELCQEVWVMAQALKNKISSIYK